MVRYDVATDDAEIARLVSESDARTVILDVEPFVTHWGSPDATFDARVASSLKIFGSMERRPDVVLFATNSRRRWREPIKVSGSLSIRYVSTACKPFRLNLYQDLPRPGVVVGDQIATDGLLAARLGYHFIHYKPADIATPLGPHLMRWLGYPFERFYFRRATN
ncbi:hypothetical protein ACQPXM_23680 [Kribbella sp. CA-253562]|uniref:hypothetical protein n=1 Tax=Kribbella sp. CA-253562 TaxID=3239942 RepID=UPI003D8E5D23